MCVVQGKFDDIPDERTYSKLHRLFRTERPDLLAEFERKWQDSRNHHLRNYATSIMTENNQLLDSAFSSKILRILNTYQTYEDIKRENFENAVNDSGVNLNEAAMSSLFEAGGGNTKDSSGLGMAIGKDITMSNLQHNVKFVPQSHGIFVKVVAENLKGLNHYLGNSHASEVLYDIMRITNDTMMQLGEMKGVRINSYRAGGSGFCFSFRF